MLTTSSRCCTPHFPAPRSPAPGRSWTLREKIPYVGRVLTNKSGVTLYYNFWQDDKNVRGIWRRCTLDEYRKPSPAWETVLDLDELSKADDVTWVWGGSTVLDEGEDVPTDRVILKLSRGGADAKIAREFDLDSKRFIPESEGGFYLPEAKSAVCWKDRDTLIVGGSFFGDAALTDSGYPHGAPAQARPEARARSAHLRGCQERCERQLAYDLDRGKRYTGGSVHSPSTRRTMRSSLRATRSCSTWSLCPLTRTLLGSPQPSI